MSKEPEERRAVTEAGLRAGLKLRAGHRVVLVLGDGIDRAKVAPFSPAPLPPGAAAAPGAAPAAVPAGVLALQLVTVSGAPAKALEVELTLPDGTRVAGKTDNDGRFTAKNLPPAGSCTLQLPDIDEGTPGAAASASGRTRYQKDLALPIGTPAVLELPPRVRRGELTGMHFETDKTFLKPTAMPGIRQLATLYKSFGASGVLVTGHTDTVGPADYNRGLSVERAETIAQFLLNDLEGWMKGYGPHAHSKPWGVREDQFMLATLTDAAGAPFYAGPIDGAAGGGTRTAYQRFQSERGLTQSGRGDDATRRALVKGYQALEGTSLPDGSAALTHGCGLTHLKVKTGPGVPNEDNRRVEIFLFDGEVAPPPQTPCPPKGCGEYQQWVDQTLISVDLDQPLPSLEVEVRDETGEPVAGASVHLAGPTPQDGTTAAGGRASFAALVPGKYKGVAAKDDFSAGDAEVEVTAGANAPLVITLSSLAALDVTVVLAAPQKSAQVTATPAGKPAVGPVGSAGAAVVVHFDRLPTGPCSLRATAPFHLEGILGVTLARGANAATLKLTALGELRGTVTSGGAKVAGAAVTLQGPSPRSTTTDAGGAYAFLNLPLGSATLAVKKPGFSDASRAVTITASASVADVVLESLTLDAFVRFEAWNVATRAFEPLAGITIEAVDDGALGNTSLDSRSSDATGTVHLQVTSAKRAPGKKIDLFFLAHPAGRRIGGVTFPAEWSTKGWLAVDGSRGYLEDFQGAAVATATAPVVFRVGVDFHLAITYEHPTFGVVRAAPGVALELNRIDSGLGLQHSVGAFALDARGEVHGLTFEAAPGNDLLIDIPGTIENAAIHLPKATFNDLPQWRTVVAENRKTSLGAQAAPFAVQGFGVRAGALNIFKVLSEWSQFLVHITAGDWAGVDGLDFFPHTLGGTSYSFPVGTVNFEKVDFFDRGVIAHELSHQIMWKQAEIGTLSIIGKFLTGKLHLRHVENLLTTDLSHPVIEGWAEAIEAIFTGRGYSVGMLTDDASAAPTIPLGPPPANRGEHCEGAFANGLFDIYTNVVGGKTVVESKADGNVLLPFMDDAGVRARFLSMIWGPLRDLKDADALSTRNFLLRLKARNPGAWHDLAHHLHRWNLMMDPPVIASLSPSTGPAGTALSIAGAEFEGGGTTVVTFDGAPAPVTVGSSARLSAQVPAGPAGAVRVVVTTAAGNASAVFTRT